VSAQRRAPFAIAEHSVQAGRSRQFELPISRLVTGTTVSLPVMVLHGRDDGPTIWLSAAVHGDELCGVEIIRRVIGALDARTLSGTVLAVPVVNVFGFNTGDRFLPDRRDLNRSFPGSPRGSLAGRIAHLMMTEVVARCSVGIDLHTGSDHRVNLPQIRGDMDDPQVRSLAEEFATPLSLHAQIRDGSLRAEAANAGARVLLFEGGEADRFDEGAITAGTAGVLRAMRHLGMIAYAPEPTEPTVVSRASRWMRAGRSGIARLEVGLGDTVSHGERIGTLRDTFGKRLGSVSSRVSGMVIGHTQRPLVNRGDAVVHVAEL
jgi:uncharacterized protein